MILSRVTGSVHATVKDAPLQGERILLTQAVDLAGAVVGRPLLALDRVDAGVGDLVLVNKEGGSARILYENEETPVQAVIVAVVDDFEIMDEREVRREPLAGRSRTPDRGDHRRSLRSASAVPCARSATRSAATAPGRARNGAPSRWTTSSRPGAGRFTAAPGIGKTSPEVAALIDHTLLKPDATEREVTQLCAEAAEHGFASVCVNPVWVQHCARQLAGSRVKVCTVVGFPLGATLSEIKRAEADRAQDLGACEIDMVMAIGLLKSGRLDDVERDIAAVTSVCRKDVVVKVIIETCLLTDEEKRAACRLAVKAGADYVKTSTGFSTGGATVADIELMRAEVGPVHRSEGIRGSPGPRHARQAGGRGRDAHRRERGREDREGRMTRRRRDAHRPEDRGRPPVSHRPQEGRRRAVRAPLRRRGARGAHRIEVRLGPAGLSETPSRVRDVDRPVERARRHGDGHRNGRGQHRDRDGRAARLRRSPRPDPGRILRRRCRRRSRSATW